MKKILGSVGVLAVVGALVLGATGAFFSDTETSTGNTFTAGAIDLKVDSTQHFNNAVCVNGLWQLNGTEVATVPQYPVIGSACDGTWTETDLGAQKFFNFADIKPGDSGENTISLHVINNDAWACVDVNVTKNDDNGLTEPEGQVDTTGGVGQGELAQNVYFTAWADDGDNIWESGEPLLFSNQKGPASDVLGGKTYALADSTTGQGPVVGGQTRNIGLAWCAGDMTLITNPTQGQPNTITCNGSAMDNKTQTDSMEAAIAFRVVQSRNNIGFVCSPAPIQKTLVLENKNANWGVINDNMRGVLTYNVASPEFGYSFTASGLQVSTGYKLVYYADKQNRFVDWGGNNPGAVIGTFTTDASGNIPVTTGNSDLAMDLPAASDWNATLPANYCLTPDFYSTCQGAKVWLVPSNDYSAGEFKLTAWNPATYLFETDLIIYNDTNN